MAGVRDWSRSVGLLSILLAAASVAHADPLQEPYTFSSTNGVLDLLMVAEAAKVPTLSPLNPTGFVYSVCRRPSNPMLETCPPPPAGVIPYAGPLLKLQQGDTVKVHLVNKLPPLTDSKHAGNPEEPQEAFLALNPTNLHFHGMLVSAHYPTVAAPNYGDNIFVYTFNPDNGMPPLLAAAHADVRMHATDYSFTIPNNHPSGLFWVHSHIHGISLNQISSGLSGTISIGNVGDYVCNNAPCAGFFKTLPIRHLVIKDLQVLADGARKDQPDTTMCLSPSNGGLVLPPLNGFCAGQDFSGAGGPNYTGARWYESVNGQTYPGMTMTSPGGEISRLVSESGSTTHNLSLYNPVTQSNMVFQVLAIDGVVLDPTAAAPNPGLMHVVPCPGIDAPSHGPGHNAARPVCADQLLMMPSSRVEIWVAYRNAAGFLTHAPAGAHATLLDSGYNTGPAGDTWPAAYLASVNFAPSGAVNPPPYLDTSEAPVSVTHPVRIFQDLNQDATTASITPDEGVNTRKCTPLAPGHRRRIYFNVPSDYPDLFGLGYEEVDANGPPDRFGNYPGVPNTFKVITEYNGAMPTVCLTLGPDGAPIPEIWELVNLSGENHNFHMHQTKFSVVSMPSESGATSPSEIDGSSVFLDNIPVVHANGATDPSSPYFDANSPGGCSSVELWKRGICRSTPTIVKIPFFVAGDYVFHCHILEHEDGGMMARVRVRLLAGN